MCVRTLAVGGHPLPVGGMPCRATGFGSPRVLDRPVWNGLPSGRRVCGRGRPLSVHRDHINAMARSA